MTSDWSIQAFSMTSMWCSSAFENCFDSANTREKEKNQNADIEKLNSISDYVGYICCVCYTK